MVAFLAYAVLYLLVLAAAIALVMYSSIVIGLLMTRGVPFISIPPADWKLMSEAAELKPGQLVFDLGCGKANLLVVAAKGFGVKGVGYELALWPYLWGKWRVWRSGAKVELHLKDFFDADISQADVVFCYLFPHIMTRLQAKFSRELKPGAKVVSYGFVLPDAKPIKVVSGAQRVTAWLKRRRHVSEISVYQF